MFKSPPAERGRLVPHGIVPSTVDEARRAIIRLAAEVKDEVLLSYYVDVFRVLATGKYNPSVCEGSEEDFTPPAVDDSEEVSDLKAVIADLRISNDEKAARIASLESADSSNVVAELQARIEELELAASVVEKIEEIVENTNPEMAPLPQGEFLPEPETEAPSNPSDATIASEVFHVDVVEEDEEDGSSDEGDDEPR